MAALLLLAMFPAMATGGEFRFPVGLTYASGPGKLMDKIKENYKVSDNFVLPVGIVMNPYYSFDSGVGIGGSIGPFAYMAINDSWGSSNTNIVLPLGLDVRYTLFTGSSFSPYVRGGFRYPVAGGDYIVSKSAGFFGGVGAELFRINRMAVSLDISYDSSTIEVKDSAPGAKTTARPQTVEPCGFMGGLYLVF